MKLESAFQKEFKDRLKEILPLCIIKRNSTDDIQGFPDLTVYCGDKYALIECKRYKDAPHRPNQDYYIELFRSEGVYATFVYPENVDTVLVELETYFKDKKKRR